MSSTPRRTATIMRTTQRRTRINPFRHETQTQKSRREKNAEWSLQSLRRLEALHHGELPMPSSTQALQHYNESNSHSQHPHDYNQNSEWETMREPPRPSTNLSQRISNFNSLLERKRTQDNWNKNLPQLHAVYMWLKIKTGNWTFDNSFDSAEAQFCTCKSFTYRMVDIVDLMWQKRVKLKFCDCLPDVVRLLTTGYIASTPCRPQTAFSVRLLQFHNLAWQWCNVGTLPFIEMLSRWLEERSSRLWNRESTARRDLRESFSASVDIYRQMLLKTTDCVDDCLQLTKTQKLARSCCPGCFGPSPPDHYYSAKPSVKNSLIVCLDGNFQHRHNSQAGIPGLPLVIPPIFIPPANVEAMEDEIHNLGTTDTAVDPCSESHKAANDQRSETTWKGCDDTGLMGCCCRHDGVVYMANIHRSGEKRSLPIALLKRLFDEIEPGRPVGVLYDIGCALHKFLRTRNFFAFPHKREQVKFATSVFHAYVHEWKCQVEYNPRYNIGWGLSDGEGLERLWSSLSPLVRPLRYSSRNHRLGALSHRCQFHNSEGRTTLMVWLRKKLCVAQSRLRDARERISSLLIQKNPFAQDGTNYTVDYFKSQWQAQLTFLNGVTNENAARRLKLTQLLEKQEAFHKLRKLLREGQWGTHPEAIRKIAEDLRDCIEAEREIAAELGMLYNETGSDLSKEKALLLLWSVKRDLYAKSVEIMGVRQPIVESQTRGRRVGTKLKEKIFESIKRRKAAIVRLINRYNERYEAFLKKYDRTTLENPNFKPLTWDLFVVMKLDDTFWNDSTYHHSKAPWAVSPVVREGVLATHLMERAEEEVDLISQELVRAINWAVELHTQLDTVAAQLGNLPADSDEEVVTTRLATLDAKTSQHTIKCELYIQLADHQEVMKTWASDVEWLWQQTRLVASSHPWFETIRHVKSNPITAAVATEEENEDHPDQDHQEMHQLADAEDGELADDEAVQAMIEATEDSGA